MASRNAIRPNVQSESPRHHRTSSFAPHSSSNIEYDHVHRLAGEEMKGLFFGPVEPDHFLTDFLPVDRSSLPESSKFTSARHKLASVSRKSLEAEMYKPFIAAVGAFCSNLKLRDTSKHEDPESGVYLNRCINPDISIYDKDDAPLFNERPTIARRMVGHGEFKIRNEQEPFDDNHMEFEKDTLLGLDTRGQITTYANAIQGLQYRTHSFSFFILKNYCRLIYWCRGGSIVTKRFDYTSTDYLLLFFWGLSRATASLRGLDKSYKLLDPQSTTAAEARSALSVEPDEPLYKVSITDDDSQRTTEYIVTTPFTNNHQYPVGRGTRCFRAYDVLTKTIVLLKDSWRVIGYEKEGEIYRKLNKHNVRYVAKLVTAGAARAKADNLEVVFRRVTRLFPKWKIRFLGHYFLVLDIVGNRLTKFPSTWKLVNAMRHALIAHMDACKIGILHRDISPGNIIIVEGGGMLIDWEFSRDITQTRPRVMERTGTWQFISARLLLDSENLLKHRIGDDLESFVHVLSWVAAKYAPNDMEITERTTFLGGFDQRIPKSNGIKSGGITKRDHLRLGSPKIRDIGLHQKPLISLLSSLYEGFGVRYGSTIFYQLKEEGKEQEMLDRLESHEWIMGLFEEALKNTQWKASEDHFVVHPVVPSARVESQKRKPQAAPNDDNTGVVFVKRQKLESMAT